MECSAAPGTKPILRVLDSGEEYDASILSCTETPLLVYIVSEESARPYGDFMFLCARDGSVAIDDQWAEWDTTVCIDPTSDSPAICNQSGVQTRARLVNGIEETETQSCTKTCSHSCVLNDQTHRPSLCNQGQWSKIFRPLQN